MLLPHFPYGTGVGVENGRNENISLLKGNGRDDRNEGGEEKEECSHERGRHHREKCGEEEQQTKKTKQKVRVCRMGTGGDGLDRVSGESLYRGPVHAIAQGVYVSGSRCGATGPVPLLIWMWADTSRRHSIDSTLR